MILRSIGKKKNICLYPETAGPRNRQKFKESLRDHGKLVNNLQNFAGRILTNTKKFDQITPVLHELGWLTIEELLCLRDVTMIFKFLNGLVPSYLSTKFVKRSETHS